jgi:hypothetical protein
MGAYECQVVLLGIQNTPDRETAHGGIHLVVAGAVDEVVLILPAAWGHGGMTDSKTRAWGLLSFEK